MRDCPSGCGLKVYETYLHITKKNAKGRSISKIVYVCEKCRKEYIVENKDLVIIHLNEETNL